MKTNMDMNHTHGEAMDGVSDPFSRDTAGLALAIAPETVVLQPDDVLELRAEQVRKRIGDTTVKMLAYNRSIPGPTLQVAQGSEVTVHFTNDTDLETTVHWHGLRLENRFDGVPTGAHQGMMAPVPIGAVSPTGCAFPMLASTGTTRICGKTIPRNWVSTRRSSSSPPTRRTGRP